MRFSEVVQPETYPGGFQTIPDPKFTALIEDWCKKMGKKTGYRRETRMEHWQEAIDIVYTALEEQYQSTDPNRIMGDSKWEIMMLAAKTYFPEHIDLYHPTLVEEQRVARLIHISNTRRLVKDKMELMRILKGDKGLKVESITDITLSRLQCEVLAASAQILVAKARSSGFHEYTTNFEKSAKRESSVTGKREGAGVVLKGQASAEAKAGVSYNSGVRKIGHGFTHKVEAAASAHAMGEVHGNYKASASQLVASGNAGLSAETAVQTEFDYEITRSCKVKTDYLRRIMGDKFKLIEGHIHGEAKAGAWGHAEAAASTGFDYKSHNIVDQKNDFFSTTTDTDPNKKSFNVANLHGEAEVEIGVSLSGTAGLRLLQTADIELSGDLFGGARAIGEAKFKLNGQGVAMDLNAAAFAGLEVGFDQKLTLTHPSRKVTIFKIDLREAFSAGIGAQARMKGKATYDEITLDTYVGSTLGIGTNVGFDTTTSPRGLLLVGYDLIMVPSILALGSLMARRDPQMASVHTRRMQQICNFLNRQASKGEVNQVYLDCRTRMMALLASLDAESDKLLSSKRTMRPAGFAGYESATLKDASTLQSTYIEKVQEPRQTPLETVFGSEAGEGNARIKLVGVGEGDRGKTITQTKLPGLVERRTDAVNPAKGDLYRIVSEYEKAKVKGKGERLAFEIVRGDVIKGTIPYA